jgi:hypothetical protein
MNIRLLSTLVVSALIPVIAAALEKVSKPPKQDLPTAVMSLKWQTPKPDSVCPSHSIVRNRSAKPCVMKTTREPQITVTLSPGETVYTGVEFRFGPVPQKLEMTTIPLETTSAAMRQATEPRQ